MSAKKRKVFVGIFFLKAGNFFKKKKNDYEGGWGWGGGGGGGGKPLSAKKM